MTNLYECHVTVALPTDRANYESIGRLWNWKTSFIYGDPVLGDKPYFCFTAHDTDYIDIFNRMKALCEFLGSSVIRRKIELILYDLKTPLDGRTL